MEATRGATRGTCRSLRRGFGVWGFDPIHPITPSHKHPLCLLPAGFRAAPWQPGCRQHAPEPSEQPVDSRHPREQSHAATAGQVREGGRGRGVQSHVVTAEPHQRVTAPAPPLPPLQAPPLHHGPVSLWPRPACHRPPAAPARLRPCLCGGVQGEDMYGEVWIHPSDVQSDDMRAYMLVMLQKHPLLSTSVDKCEHHTYPIFLPVPTPPAERGFGRGGAVHSKGVPDQLRG